MESYENNLDNSSVISHDLCFLFFFLFFVYLFSHYRRKEEHKHKDLFPNLRPSASYWSRIDPR